MSNLLRRWDWTPKLRATQTGGTSYFRPSDGEIDNIWANGILTVDANVLLDLYRYHENTRNSLILSLENFRGRLWISHQAATEFFRNRNKVIVSSTKGFKQAKDEVEKLRKSLQAILDQLKGNRIIPTSISEDLSKAISDSLDTADNKITSAAESFPDYLKDDPLLAKLVEMFDGAVGEGFNEKDKKDISAEAAARRKDKIPPGYLDEDKDGDRPYGDFYLWRQILDYAKNKNTPMIFVTSERKEDWWEKPAGQTIGPRYELRKEANDYAKQRILIYQTDRFLQLASERTGNRIDPDAVEEIRAIDSIRSSSQNAVVVLDQTVLVNSEASNRGVLIVELTRPIMNFTASGHFEPRMLDVPRLAVHVLSTPLNTPRHRISGGTGTNHDFNIHLHSLELGQKLPIGTYMFEYTARSEDESMKDPGDQTAACE